MPDEPTRLTRAQIEEIIPHRAPFLLVDRIVDVEFGKRAVGIMDDPASPHHDFWVRGHFPGFAVLPGALLIEALAEVGAVGALGLAENRGKIAVLTGVDHWKFRQMALPGTSVRLEVELVNLRRNFGKGHARALADDRLLCEGDLSFAIADRPEGLRAPG
jgi:3-hydroxyacyl-[acyl-carrier-protein] dehydratase